MGKQYKKLYAKMRGRNYVVHTRTCSINSFESLKLSADYKFHLEFLIQPSSGQLKMVCDFRIIHFYYTLEHFSIDEKEAGKKTTFT